MSAGAPSSSPDLRPLGIGEILDVAIKIYWRNALTFFAAVLVVVLPVQVLIALVQASATPSFRESGFRSDTSGQSVGLTVTATLLVAILGFVAGTLATGACYKGVADAYLSERANWKSSLRFAARRLHSIVWVTILGAILAALGLIACIVPGVYLYVSWIVAVPVLLTEGLKGRKALGRSRQLVAGRWWPTFGIVVLGAVLTGIVNSGIGAALGAASFGAGTDTPAGVLLAIASGTVGSTLTTPFTAAYISVLYFDLRVRKEGFDLQLLAERVGIARPPEGETRPAPAPAFLPQAPPPPLAGKQPPFWPPPPGWKPTDQP